MLYKLYTTVYLKYLKNNFSISAVFRRKYIKYIFKYIKGRLAFNTYRHEAVQERETVIIIFVYGIC